MHEITTNTTSLAKKEQRQTNKLLMNGDLPGVDIGLWTISLLVGSSRIITWWAASLLGSEGMISQ
jgi:hypothetical protein